MFNNFLVTVYALYVEVAFSIIKFRNTQLHDKQMNIL